MANYKCNKCGTHFTEETAGYTEELCPTDRGVQHLQDDMRCPHCDSYNYDEVYECPICKELESRDYDEPCEDCMDDLLYWTAQAMVNIMMWLNIKDTEKVSEYIEEAMWKLTREDDAIAYLAKVLAERKSNNGNNEY